MTIGTTAFGDEVAPAIRCLPVRTPTLPPATHTNAYVVGTREIVLVEPASPYDDEIDRIAAFVDEERARGARPIAILATHHHPDHVGGAVALRDRLRLPLWGHPKTIERLLGAVAFDRAIGDGERIAIDGPSRVVLEAVHTPGHAPGHLCFLDRASGALIAGDMVAGIGTILVEPIDGDMALYLESLRRMASLRASVLLPAHGDPIRDPEACLDHYVAHRLMREEKVAKALAAHGGAAAPADLVPAAYDDAPRAVWPIAAAALEAHLIKLEREGRARRTSDGWLP